MDTYKYYSNNFGDNVAYFVFIWDDIIEKFNETSRTASIIDAQALLNEIVDEYNFNSLDNKTNNKIFDEYLHKFVNTDPVIRDNYKSEFHILKESIKRGQGSYAKQICLELLPIFISGKYFKMTLKALCQSLAREPGKSLDQKLITLLCRTLISQYRHKGYALNTIRYFSRNVFSGYYLNKGVVITNFPYNLSPDEHEKDRVLDNSEFNQHILNKLDSLTIEDRINALAHYYEKDPKNFTCIFQVKGLKGNMDVNVGPVNIYSPFTKTYLSPSDRWHNKEFFGTNESQNFANAAVSVTVIDKANAAINARSELDRVLDILKLSINQSSDFFPSKEYLVLSETGDFVTEGRSYSEYSDRVTWHRSVDLHLAKEQELVDEVLLTRAASTLCDSEKELSDLDSRLLYSSHWFRKGDQAHIPEDKFLHYWIALENLTAAIPNSVDQSESKISLITRYVPSLLMPTILHDPGWELFYELSNIVRMGATENENCDFSEEIIREANLDPELNVDIYLKPFIENIQNLINNCKNEYLLEKLYFVKNYYHDRSITKATIQQIVESIQTDLTLMYRLRNKIVHKAHVEHKDIDYYTAKLKPYTETVIRVFSLERYIENKKTCAEVLNSFYAKYNVLIDKLGNNRITSLLEFSLFN